MVRTYLGHYSQRELMSSWQTLSNSPKSKVPPSLLSVSLAFCVHSLTHALLSLCTSGCGTVQEALARDCTTLFGLLALGQDPTVKKGLAYSQNSNLLFQALLSCLQDLSATTSSQKSREHICRMS